MRNESYLDFVPIGCKHYGQVSCYKPGYTLESQHYNQISPKKVVNFIFIHKLDEKCLACYASIRHI